MQDTENQSDKIGEVKISGEALAHPENLPVISQTNSANSSNGSLSSVPPGESAVVVTSTQENHIPVWFLLLFFATLLLFLTMTFALYQKITYRKTLSPQKVSHSDQIPASLTPSPLPQEERKEDFTPLSLSDELSVVEDDIDNTNIELLDVSLEKLDREVVGTR